MAVPVTWTPHQPTAMGIVQLLRAANDPNADHAAVSAQLQSLNAANSGVKDLQQHLAAILQTSNAPEIDETTRQSAGLLLKNNLRDGNTYTAIDVAGLEYIKATLLACMRLQSPTLRRTAASCTAALVSVMGISTWRALVDTLRTRIEQEGDETALDTLHEILEESKMLEMKGSRPETLCLECQVEGLHQTPAAILVPVLIRVAQMNPLPAPIASLCLKCLNIIAGYMPRPIVEEMHAYATALFTRAMDADVGVRVAVCQGLVALLSIYPGVLEGHWDQIVEYMLSTTSDASQPELARESCEFWMAYCEAALPSEVLKKRLVEIVKVLMVNMAFAEDDEEVFEVEEEEMQIRQGGAVRERQEELKPFFGKGKGAAGVGGQGDGALGDGEGEEEEDDDDYTSSWNLRKCSAASLDSLSDVFAGDADFLRMVLSESQARLDSKTWRMVEAATLALGAIANGCADGMRSHLPALVGMLLPQLSSEHPLVRSISCWSLSRYGRLLGEAADSDQGRQLLESVIRGTLVCMRDGNRKVQESACSAISALEEDCEIVPGLATVFTAVLPLVVESVAHGLGAYGQRVLPTLTDALGTLAEKFGGTLAEPGVASVLMPAFIARWNATADADQSLLPLMECLVSLTQAMEVGIAPYAEAFYMRSDAICKAQLGAKNASAAADCDRDLVMLSLDLMCGIVESLGPATGAIVVQLRTVELAAAWCDDKLPSVRQSAFALIGELAKAVPAHVHVVVPHCLSLATAMLDASQLTAENMGAANNACWAVGELAMAMAIQQQRQTYEQGALALAERLVAVLGSNRSVNVSLFENSAIALGRLAVVVPESLSPHLEQFITPWCYGLCRIRDGEEKRDAFTGLFKLIRLQPSSLGPGIIPLACAVASWRQVVSAPLRAEMKEVMCVYKAGVTEEQWESLLSNLGSYKDRIMTLMM